MEAVSATLRFKGYLAQYCGNQPGEALPRASVINALAELPIAFRGHPHRKLEIVLAGEVQDAGERRYLPDSAITSLLDRLRVNYD